MLLFVSESEVRSVGVRRMKFGWRPFGSGKKKTGGCLSKGLNEKIVNCELHVSSGMYLYDDFLN